MANGSELLNRYYETLGLRPGASLEDVNTTYLTLIKRIRENPTEEEEARLVQLRQAYDRIRRSVAPSPRTAAPSPKRSDEAAAGAKAGSDPLSRYFETLGLRPGASLEEINTTYFTRIKRIRENPTEEEEAKLVQLRQAYDRLRKSYVPASKPLFVAPNPRQLIPVLGVLSILLLGGLVYANWGALKIKMTRYDRGAVLRLKHKSEPFGQVVGYESRHQFPTGLPGAAYAIRLSGREETLWVSERVVVVGMVPFAAN
jgi:hypothetical protein